MLDEGRLARPEIADPCLEIDDLARDVGGVGLLADLRPERAEGVEGVLPAVGRDPIADRRDDVLAVAVLL